MLGLGAPYFGPLALLYPFFLACLLLKGDILGVPHLGAVFVLAL